jgi:hypothetical protein
MEKAKNFFRKSGFSIFLFFAAFILFSWPILSIVNNGHTKLLFIYLFSAWGIIITLLLFMSRSYGRSARNNGKSLEEDGPDV